MPATGMQANIGKKSHTNANNVRTSQWFASNVSHDSCVNATHAHACPVDAK
jgi:hypothetical protein